MQMRVKALASSAGVDYDRQDNGVFSLYAVQLNMIDFDADLAAMRTVFRQCTEEAAQKNAHRP